MGLEPWCSLNGLAGELCESPGIVTFCAYERGEEKEGSRAFPNEILKGALLGCQGFLHWSQMEQVFSVPWATSPGPRLIPVRLRGPAPVKGGSLPL